jgi:nucleoside-diphosphate-sugar epimerase
MNADFAGQQVLVTGATGFIGGHLSPRLVSENVKVRALARDPARAGALAQSGVEVVRGDLRDPASLAAAVRDCRCIFHLAGIVDDFVPDADYRAVNVEGTRALAEAALAAGVQRFVYVSTIGVYGLRPERDADERAPDVPSNDAYSDTKLEAEQIVRRFVAERGLPAAIAQLGVAYGPRDDAWTLAPLKRIRSGGMLLPGGGAALLQPIYIDDVIEGILAVARKGAVGERYILRGPETVTLKQYFGELARIAGKRSIPSVPAWAAFALADLTTALSRITGQVPMATRAQILWLTASRTFSGRKAREELGFEAAIDLKTGMARLEEWLRRTKT